MHEKETLELISELQQITARGLGVSLDDSLCQRLLDYSLSIPEYKGAVKEWRWRNGWLWSREQSPLHRFYLGDLVKAL